MPARSRIIVTGLVGLHPVGGVAWDYLQYVVGLADLGHDVIYHEDTWSWPFDPLRNTNVAEPDYSAAFLDQFFAAYAPQLRDRWHYRHLHTSSHGMDHRAFRDFAGSADLYLNVSGAGLLPEELRDGCLKVFVDTDPGYNQIVLTERPSWSQNVDAWRDAVMSHDVHVTYGESIASGSSSSPDAGVSWKPTRMPVVPQLWRDLRSAPPDAAAPWTTVMTWNAFRGRLSHAGREYGGKDWEFASLLHLPGAINRRLRIAVGGTLAPLDDLRAHGWEVADGPGATRTAASYREFLGSSWGELSCAKNVYVALNTGWTSTRTACYLASGRPCIVQETGLSEHVPTGTGLLTFQTADEAIEATRRVESDWRLHSDAAARLAAEHFAAPRVLTDLLDSL